MKKKIFLFAACALILGLTAALFYANKTLPTVVREKIVTGIEASTGGRATLRAVSFSLLRGIVISGLVVTDKNDARQEILSIQDASATFLFLPFLKDRKIIIPSIVLNGATVHLARHKDNTFNISYLFSPPPGTEAFWPVINYMRITDSHIVFADESLTPNLTLTLNIKDLTVRSLWKKIFFEAHGALARDAETVPLDVSGTYLPDAARLEAQLTCDRITSALLAPYRSSLPVTLEHGVIKTIRIKATTIDKNVQADASFHLEDTHLTKDKFSLTEGSAEVTAVFKGRLDDWRNFTAQSHVHIKDAALTLRDKTTAVGTVTDSQIDVTYDGKIVTLKHLINLKDVTAHMQDATLTGGSALIEATFNPSGLSYAGTAQVAALQVEGLPRVEQLNNVTATLAFKNNDITIREASAGVLKAVITAQGRFAANILTLDLKGEFDIADLIRLVPKTVELPDYKVSGAVLIRAHAAYDTAAAPPAGRALKAEAELKDIWLNLAKNHQVFAAKGGRLSFDSAGEHIDWHFPSVLVNNRDTYSWDGTLKNFGTPEINTILTGPDIKCSALFTKDKDALSIAEFKGQYKNSHADLSGSADLAAEKFSAAGKILLDLTDLQAAAPDLKKMGLRGRAVLDVTANGPIKNYRRWNMTAKGESPDCRAYGYQVKKVVLDYDQVNGEGFINNLAFDVYNGTALIKGRINLAKEPPTFAIRGAVDNLDLSALKNDNPSLKEKTFYGILTLKASLQGIGADLDSLTGGGQVTVKNGNIWEYSPLKGLGNFLFIPRFTTLTFTHAQGDVYVKESVLTTDNLELTGPELGLLIEGRMGFDGTIDFLINSQIPLPGPVEKLETTRLGERVAKAGSLTAIRVTGTLQNPQYRLLAIKDNIMKKINDVVSSILP